LLSPQRGELRSLSGEADSLRGTILRFLVGLRRKSDKLLAGGRI
jgi:hypothetical protein